MSPGYGAPYPSSPEGFWYALREVWLAPRRFFRRLDPGGGIVRPALFAAAVLYLNLLLGTFLRSILAGGFEYSLLYAPLLGLAVSAVLGPLLVAAFAALVLFVLDGTPSARRMGPLFRALCYSTGPGVILWVPYGPVLAVPYGAYVATLAVRETLGVGWRRAAPATLIPLIALMVLLALLGAPLVSYPLPGSPL
ncbi:YIP1 family protein [Rubrobacter calidifluminis]|uniref:YIP1 family protein n=1 Tax=Rubrobacter calidifluminis TaxID=1392640 RepID=UPI002362D8E6|nr:YIP1 family protein [Rubrobacter calidifluminis]